MISFVELCKRLQRRGYVLTTDGTLDLDMRNIKISYNGVTFSLTPIERLDARLTNRSMYRFLHEAYLLAGLDKYVAVISKDGSYRSTEVKTVEDVVTYIRENMK